MKTVNLTSAEVTYTEAGCFTRFPDGTTWSAHPHDTAHYHVIAHRCGYGDDILAYCREHEVAHHLIGEQFYGGRSPVLWQLAHEQHPHPQEAALEEAMVMTFQRWLRANERPIIGGVNWDSLKQRALEALDA